MIDLVVCGLALVVLAVARAQAPAIAVSVWTRVTAFDSITTSSLPPVQWKALAQAVGDQTAALLISGEEQNERLLAPSARVALIHLNGSAEPDAMVMGPGNACSMKGDCPLYVFHWTGTRWKLLFDAGDAGGIYVQDKTDGGWHEVVVERQLSTTESLELLYRFNGEKYAIAGC